MHCRVNHKHLLFALLPLLIIAAALWFSAPENVSTTRQKASSNIAKAVTSPRGEIPFVSNDVPQLSRADHRSPLKNLALILLLSFLPFAFKTNTSPGVIFSAGSYSYLFKNLFPELEFS